MADWESNFDAGYADADSTFECPICLNPKVPFTTMAPCGHSCCGRCAMRENLQCCPMCRAPINARVPSAELTEQAKHRLTYSCKQENCAFEGNEEQARSHVCRIHRFRPLGHNLSEAEFVALMNSLPEDVADGQVVDAILNAESEWARRNAPPPSSLPAAPAPTAAVVATTRPTTLDGNVYWDYDSMTPNTFGSNVVSFFSALKTALEEQGVSRLVNNYAYLQTGKDYRNAPDKLSRDVAAVMRNDRATVNHDVQAHLSASNADQVVTVVVTSDAAFLARVKILTETRPLWVVHDAPQGSALEITLQGLASRSIQVFSFLPAAPTTTPERPFTAAAPTPARAVQSNTIKINGKDVPRSWLVVNPALNRLGETKWCWKHAQHDVNTCTFAHVNANFVLVDREDVEPSHGFIQNEGMRQLENAPRVALLCKRTAPHDEMNCSFLHRGVPIKGKTVPLSWLVPGAAVERAKSSPVIWCRNHDPHDLAACTFAHVVPGYIVVDAHHAEPISNFLRNKAVTDIEHGPVERTPRLGYKCTSPNEHDHSGCMFLHVKQGHPMQPEQSLHAKAPMMYTAHVKAPPHASHAKALPPLAPHAKAPPPQASHGKAPPAYEPHAPVTQVQHKTALSHQVQHTKVPPTLVPQAQAQATHKSQAKVQVSHTSQPKAPPAVPTEGVPTVVTVENEPIYVHKLRQTKGLQYLLDNSAQRPKGRMCTKASPHDIADCGHIHLNFKEDIIVNDVDRKAMDFVRNKGWRYLQDFQGAKGILCTRTAHDVEECTFMHLAPK